MPFGLRWPFRRKRSDKPESPPSVQRAEDVSEPLDVVAEVPDLAEELLNRAADLSTPPLLGSMGGLTEMAQGLPETGEVI